MPSPQPASENQVFVNDLTGLNERRKFVNPNLKQFDELNGLIPQRQGLLQRINGTKLLETIAGKRILNIHQTLDRRQNVIIQTSDGVYLFSEDELMGRTIVTNLTPVVIQEEEEFMKGIIVHQLAAATNGGSYSVANTWERAPLSAILSQMNPDGTAAAFITALAGNIFTLAAGIYRFNGWSVGSHATTTVRLTARLFNETTGLPLFNGLANAVGPSVFIGNANDNILIPIGGDIDLSGGATNISIQNLMTTAQANTGFGNPKSIGGFTNTMELYRWLEIIKTG